MSDTTIWQKLRTRAMIRAEKKKPPRALKPNISRSDSFRDQFVPAKRTVRTPIPVPARRA